MQYEEYGNAKYLGNHLIKAVKEDITTVDIKQGTKTIADYAFGYCIGLTSVTIPNGVVSIGDRAFKYCSSLTSITIPDSVTSIGEEAFYDCWGLTSITIPTSVTSIGYWAFRYCSSLTINVRAASKPSGWDSNWNYGNCPVNWGYKG